MKVPGPYGEEREVVWAQPGGEITHDHRPALEAFAKELEEKAKHEDHSRKLFFFDEFTKQIRDTLGVKGSDYAYRGHVFWNFNEVAERVQALPRQVWGTFWAKHVVAIEKWISVGELDDESIEGRLLDCACYCCILYAALKMGLVK